MWISRKSLRFSLEFSFDNNNIIAKWIFLDIFSCQGYNDLLKHEIIYKNRVVVSFVDFFVAIEIVNGNIYKKEGRDFFGRLPRIYIHVFIEKINLPCEERLSAAFSIPRSVSLRRRYTLDDRSTFRFCARKTDDPIRSDPPLFPPLPHLNSAPRARSCARLWISKSFDIVVRLAAAAVPDPRALFRGRSRRECLAMYEQHACRHQIRSV